MNATSSIQLLKKLRLIYSMTFFTKRIEEEVGSSKSSSLMKWITCSLTRRSWPARSVHPCLALSIFKLCLCVYRHSLGVTYYALIAFCCPFLKRTSSLWSMMCLEYLKMKRSLRQYQMKVMRKKSKVSCVYEDNQIRRMIRAAMKKTQGRSGLCSFLKV